MAHPHVYFLPNGLATISPVTPHNAAPNGFPHNPALHQPQGRSAAPHAGATSCLEDDNVSLPTSTPPSLPAASKSGIPPPAADPTIVHPFGSQGGGTHHQHPGPQHAHPSPPLVPAEPLRHHHASSPHQPPPHRNPSPHHPPPHRDPSPPPPLIPPPSPSPSPPPSPSSP